MGLQEKDFEGQLHERVTKAQQMIEEALPGQIQQGLDRQVPERIVEAVNYSVLAGGKRLRPVLMLEMYEMFGGKFPGIERFAAAIEMIHTYSLVHDDLPSMDNDEYRRGRKTTWAVYGDAMGVLAGDALLNFAFETAAGAFDACTAAEEYRAVARALQILGHNAGIYGMIGGQVADIEAEGQSEAVTQEQLLYIHTHKTGALIRAAMQVGAVLGGETREEVLEAISQCAMDIGVAFQIQDDILDVVGDSAELGKPIGSDAANGKQTYVTLRGLEESGREVERLSEDAVRILQDFPGEHDFMEGLIRHLTNRRN